MDKELLEIAKKDGKIQERYRIAQNLIYSGIDIDTVCYFTNLSRRKAVMIYEYYQGMNVRKTDQFMRPDNRDESIPTIQKKVLYA